MRRPWWPRSAERRRSGAAATWRLGWGWSRSRRRREAGRSCSGSAKRGDGYLRRMPVHGARAALRMLSKTDTALGRWPRGLLERAHRNAVVVALAAKLARVACAVLRSGRGGFEVGAAVTPWRTGSAAGAGPA